METHAFGTIAALGVTCEDVLVAIIGPGHSPPNYAAVQYVGHMDPGDLVSWSLSWNALPSIAGAVQIYVSATITSAPSLSHLNYTCSIWTFRQAPQQRQQQCNNWAVLPPAH